MHTLVLRLAMRQYTVLYYAEVILCRSYAMQKLRFACRGYAMQRLYHTNFKMPSKSCIVI